MTEIVQKDSKNGDILRQIAKPVSVSDIKSSHIQKVVSDMHEALATQKNGVALAAPQIAISLRIFVISPKAFGPEDEDIQLVFINPEITKRSKDRKLMDEGCLSVKPWYGKVRRNSRVSVKAYDIDGNEFEMDGKGLIAHIFQHEIDHLDGILFVDKATDLKEVKRDEDKEKLKETRDEEYKK